MADESGLALFFEDLGTQPGADLLLEGKAPDRGILEALDQHAGHLLANTGQENGQGVHGKTWVDSCAQYGDLMFLGQVVDAGGQVGIGVEGKGQLLAGGDDRFSGLYAEFQLSLELTECGTGRQQDHIGRLGQNRLGIGRDLDPQAPGAGEGTDIPAGFFGIDVDGSDQFDPIAFSQVLDGPLADGAQAHLNHFNGSFFSAHIRTC